MFDLTPENLMKEIRACVDSMESEHEARATMIRRGAGRSKAGNDRDKSKATPRNYYFSYPQFVNPQILYGEPKCAVEPSHQVRLKDQAEALELGSNSCSKENDLRGTLKECLADMHGGWAIAKFGLQDAQSGAGVSEDFNARPNYLFCVRIPPRNFFYKHADSQHKCRLMGDFFDRDIDDVRNDARYPADRREQLQPTAREAGEATFETPITEMDQKRITLYEVYIPEAGLIITLAETGKTSAIELRREKFHGPRLGPYAIGYFCDVAGEMLGTSPLMSLEDQISEVNIHAADLTDCAENHKEFFVCDSAFPVTSEAIKTVKNGDVLAVQGGKAGVEHVSLFAVSKEAIEYTEYIDGVLQKDMGYGSAQQGQSNSDTATANDIASSSSDFRISGMKDAFGRFVQRIFEGWAWYLYHDSTIKPMRVTVTDPTTQQPQDATFLSGKWEGGYEPIDGQFVEADPESDFTDFQFVVDVKLLGKQDDAVEQKRAVERYGLFTQTFQTFAPILGPQAFNVKAAIDDLGDAFNVPKLSDRWLNPEAVQIDPMTGMPMQPQVQPGQIPGTPAMGQAPGPSNPSMGTSRAALIGAAGRVR